jgi:hypothetical protein
MQVPKNPTAADYDRFVKFISDGAKRGEWSLDDARHAMTALETRKEDILAEYLEYEQKRDNAIKEGKEDFADKLLKEQNVFFKLVIDNAGSGEIDPKRAKSAIKDAQGLLDKATDQIQSQTPAQVEAMLGRGLSQIIAFAGEGGFASGGPDVRSPTDTAKIASNVRGVSRAAKHVLKELGADPSIIEGELSDEAYQSWVELSKDGKAGEWLDSIEFDSGSIDPGVLDRLNLDDANIDAFGNFLQGAYREDLQYKAIKRMRDEAVGLAKKAELNETLSTEEIARLRTLSNSMAHTSLGLEGITLESEVLEEVEALGESPQMNYSYSGDIENRADQLAFAKSVALAEDGEAQMAMLQTAGDLLASGIDSSGRPIYSRGRSRDPMSSNPFIQPVLDKIELTKTVQTSPLFYEMASDLGMNLAEGERPSVGQLNRVLRLGQRDKRRAYRPTGTYMEVDVIDRDRALEVKDGQFVSFVDEESGDFISLDDMQRRSEAALSERDTNPVVEFDLDDAGVRTIMGMSLDDASADKVREINKLYGLDPSRAAGSSVVVDRSTNEVAVIGPDRQVFFRGNIKDDQVAAINDAALNSNVAHVAADPAAVREGKYGTPLTSLDGLTRGTRYNAHLYAPPGTKLSMETPLRKVKGFTARQKYGGDQSRFVVMGGDRKGEQILFSDVRGEAFSSADLGAEDAAQRMGITPGQVERLRRRDDRRSRRSRSEYKKGKGTYSNEPIAREKTPMQKALEPPPMTDAEVEATLPDKSNQVKIPEAEPPAAVPDVAAPVVPPPAASPPPKTRSPGRSTPPKDAGAPVVELAPVHPPLAEPHTQEELANMRRIPRTLYEVPHGRAPYEALADGEEEAERKKSEYAQALVEEQLVGVVPGTRRP